MTAVPSPEMPPGASFIAHDVHAAARIARNWMFQDVLPLWAGVGHDSVHGGFFEQIDQSAAPVLLPKRCRVQARQCYSFVAAGRLGWDGPWQALAKSGADFMLKYHTRPDGLMRFTTDIAGQVLDNSADNYDQAFALFALANLYSATGDAAIPERAKSLLGALRADRAHPLGGFYEHTGKDASLLANPHMHLFEAALAWLDVAPEDCWRQLAQEIADLCTTRFIEPKRIALREYFTPEWLPETGDRGRITEPGHQFEWAWLLARWNGFGGSVDQAVIRGLYQSGADGGIDDNRSIAISEVWVDGSVKNAATRLWPQTERMKAAITMARHYPEERASFEQAIIGSWKGLSSFISKENRGLYLDIQHPDGGFQQAPSPASSLYHIICAVEELVTYSSELHETSQAGRI